MYVCVCVCVCVEGRGLRAMALQLSLTHSHAVRFMLVAMVCVRHVGCRQVRVGCVMETALALVGAYGVHSPDLELLSVEDLLFDHVPTLKCRARTLVGHTRAHALSD